MGKATSEVMGTLLNWAASSAAKGNGQWSTAAHAPYACAARCLCGEQIVGLTTGSKAGDDGWTAAHQALFPDGAADGGRTGLTSVEGGVGTAKAFVRRKTTLVERNGTQRQGIDEGHAQSVDVWA